MSPLPYARPRPSVTNATVPGVAPPAVYSASPSSNEEFRLPRVLPDVVDFNATVPDAPPSANMTVPGLGGELRHNTEPIPIELPLVGPASGPGALVGPASGLGPASDPFVENAITAPAPLTPKSGAPSPGALGKIPAPPPDPDDLVRGLEKDRGTQTPIAHVAESRGRDGASHAAIVQPAQGQAPRPIEPLVVVDVGTDPTSRSVTSAVSTPTHAAISEVPRGVPRTKGRVILMLCIFGVCLMLAVGILGTLAAKYLPHAPQQQAREGAATVTPSARAALKPPSPAVASPSISAPKASAVPPPPSSEPEQADESAAPSRPPASRSTTSRPSKSSAPSAPVRHANELERGID
ncbi:hypothetical protein LVJ94_37210 [Pendulispora rubella]|uniref:Uncharacterized protein n=1 Tax=Pendulispora rubella TaxID=2741070 RepID=A0ABZ2KV29_9BACT